MVSIFMLWGHFYILYCPSGDVYSFLFSSIFYLPPRRHIAFLFISVTHAMTSHGGQLLAKQTNHLIPFKPNPLDSFMTHKNINSGHSDLSIILLINNSVLCLNKVLYIAYYTPSPPFSVGGGQNGSFKGRQFDFCPY